MEARLRLEHSSWLCNSLGSAAFISFKLLYNSVNYRKQIVIQIIPVHRDATEFCLKAMQLIPSSSPPKKPVLYQLSKFFSFQYS